MKKDELVAAIADKAELSKADADRALAALVDTVTSTVAGGDKLQIPGLGTFEPRARSAREGRNPRTGESMTIAASRVPRFTAGSGLKKAVK